MGFDKSKFKSLVHYICSKCQEDPARLGATKLNKILWLSELGNFYETGESITGARYVRRQRGPVPAAILPALRELQDEGIVTSREVQFHGFTQRQFVVHGDADPRFMTDDQRQRVDEIIDFVCSRHTAKSISEASHDHIWSAAADGELLPHFTVFARAEDITDEDRDWARQQLEELRVAA